MLSVNNILAPKDGSPITTPTQDMILGKLLSDSIRVWKRETRRRKRETAKYFTDIDEMLMAYQNHEVGLHAKVKVRRCIRMKNDTRGRLVESTVGRFIFNSADSAGPGICRQRREDPYALEIDFLCDKKKLGVRLSTGAIGSHGNTGTAHHAGLY